MKLSVLVSSIVERQDYFLKRMLSILEPQLTPDVELVIETDNREISIGAKQQILLGRAQGDYLCYVDEDDVIPVYYISEILKAIQSQPDCVGINEIYTHNGKNPKPFYHSLKYDHYFEKDNVYYRPPTHMNPVKRTLAIQSHFEDAYGGDNEYTMTLLPLLKTEIVIDKCMYYYLATSR